MAGTSSIYVDVLSSSKPPCLLSPHVSYTYIYSHDIPNITRYIPSPSDRFYRWYGFPQKWGGLWHGFTLISAGFCQVPMLFCGSATRAAPVALCPSVLRQRGEREIMVFFVGSEVKWLVFSRIFKDYIRESAYSSFNPPFPESDSVISG